VFETLADVVRYYSTPDTFGTTLQFPGTRTKLDVVNAGKVQQRLIEILTPEKWMVSDLSDSDCIRVVTASSVGTFVVRKSSSDNKTWRLYVKAPPYRRGAASFGFLESPSLAKKIQIKRPLGGKDAKTIKIDIYEVDNVHKNDGLGFSLLQTGFMKTEVFDTITELIEHYSELNSNRSFVPGLDCALEVNRSQKIQDERTLSGGERRMQKKVSVALDAHDAFARSSNMSPAEPRADGVITSD